MAWIRRLFSKTRLEPREERPSYTLLCSACYTPCSGPDAHVIPWWNPQERSIFTTYRCGQCWLPSLTELQAAVDSRDPTVIASFCDFLTRQGYANDVDAIRAAPVDQACAELLTILDAVREEKVFFTP